MKKTMHLLLLSVFIALPAWAGDAVPVSAAPAATAEAGAKATPEATAKEAKKAKKTKKAKKAKQETAAEAAPLGCPTGCALMACPPPSGPVRCCNTTTHQAC